MDKKVKEKKKKSLSFKIFIGILALIIVAVTAAFISVYSFTSKINRVTYSNEDISVSKDVSNELLNYADQDLLNNITNIALFGIDGEDNNSGRSDSLMILTVDPVNSKLKLTSIMRDSYVDIPGYGMDKINHAFAFGKSTLALSTINYNFGLNVEDFIAVNFTSLPQIINKLGGVTINVTEEEVPMIPGITSAGSKLLNGEQALAYSRIRYATGGDFQRTSRHRTILAAVFNSVKDVTPSQLPSLLNEFLPLIETNFTTSELVSLGNEILQIGVDNLSEDRIPRDGYHEGVMIDGVYYLQYDIPTAKEQMREFIYKN